MTTLLFANNASTTLASPLTSSATVLSLLPGSGAAFPSPGAGQAFCLTLVDAATGLLNEIMICTSRTGDSCTVTRAQEGTTALAWSAGDIASNLITAGTAGAWIQGGAVGGAVTIANGQSLNTAVSVASFSAPATGTIAVSACLSAQTATGLTSNSYGGVIMSIRKNGTRVAHAGPTIYLPSGGQISLAGSCSHDWLPVTLGDTIDVYAQSLFIGDNTTVWSTLADSGTTDSNLTYHYIK